MIKNYQVKLKDIISQGHTLIYRYRKFDCDNLVNTNLVPLALMLYIYHIEQKFLLKQIKLKYSVIS